MRLDHGADQPVANHLSPSEAIEDLAYDLLRQTHCGWENNDGAYGEFTFDVTAGTITLDRSEEHTSELQSLMRLSYAVVCLQKKKTQIKSARRACTRYTTLI